MVGDGTYVFEHDLTAVAWDRLRVDLELRNDSIELVLERFGEWNEGSDVSEEVPHFELRDNGRASLVRVVQQGLCVVLCRSISDCVSGGVEGKTHSLQRADLPTVAFLGHAELHQRTADLCLVDAGSLGRRRGDMRSRLVSTRRRRQRCSQHIQHCTHHPISPLNGSTASQGELTSCRVESAP